jgi:2-methylisocitrate lyase-like PEP mutase family enzyme
VTDPADEFLALHEPGRPLLIPNAWDRGSARVLEALDFRAVATTSGGHAASLGRLDGSVSRDEALEHARDIADAVSVFVSSDFENGFADDPGSLAANVAAMASTGVAGCSVEDWSGSSLYDPALAAERIGAAADAAHAGPRRIVLVARAENHIRGNPDLADTIARLQSYADAGADVLYAPGLVALDDIRTLCAAVDRPVNVLALPGAPPVAALADAGVARVSVGSAFSSVALGALAAAARELRDQGTYGFWDVGIPGMAIVHEAFGSRTI